MKFYSIIQMILKLHLCFYSRSIKNYNLTSIKRKEIKFYLEFMGIELPSLKVREDKLYN